MLFRSDRHAARLRDPSTGTVNHAESATVCGQRHRSRPIVGAIRKMPAGCPDLCPEVISAGRQPGFGSRGNLTCPREETHTRLFDQVCQHHVASHCGQPFQSRRGTRQPCGGVRRRAPITTTRGNHAARLVNMPRSLLTPASPRRLGAICSRTEGVPQPYRQQAISLCYRRFEPFR